MYTRDYNSENEEINIPKNYGGTVLAHEESENADEVESTQKMVENKESVPSWVNKIGLNSFFPKLNGLFSGGFKLGTEEIIIIALLAFLLFSGSRDYECIIMLASLLLI